VPLGRVEHASGEDCRGFVAVYFGQDDVQLALDAVGLVERDRMHRTVCEQRQRRVFEFLTGADKSRQVLAVEVLGQTVQRQGEFDKGIEFAIGTIGFPASLQRFSQGNDGLGEVEHQVFFRIAQLC